MVWKEKHSYTFALHADICNLGSGLIATEYMSFLQSLGTEGQNLSPIYRSLV